MSLILKARTALALGVPSICRFLYYKLTVKLNLNPIKRIKVKPVTGTFFGESKNPYNKNLKTNNDWIFESRYFGWFKVQTDSAPQWHVNPFTGNKTEGSEKPWWSLPDFGSGFGDIKTIWEASRFDWVFPYAQRASQGDNKALTTLNDWLYDWVQKNPPYLGHNWKCGQEASIRVMHLAMAAIIVGQAEKPEPGLIKLIEVHMLRIAPTISYAIAQNNNHGTSEAAALFIGGSWLEKQGYPKATKWKKLGRKWLENRANKLIESDGSFSQYSVTYHRVMLDTYNMVEIWRSKMSLPKFTPNLYKKLSAASFWLYDFTIEENGAAPNIGANDGARLLPISDTDYRDFRPTVQLSMALFNDVSAFKSDGSWNLPLKWFDLKIPEKPVESRNSKQYDNGGYSLLRKGRAFVVLRYPRFRYRPSHADALHVDFWLSSENILRDGGTFSYNPDVQTLNYFSGTEGHNTIQFDRRDQMPRLSRFLFGGWLRAKNVSPIQENESATECAAGYRDSFGASHYRQVKLLANKLIIVDEVKNFHRKAIIRWRLIPGQWVLDVNSLSNGKINIDIITEIPIERIELVEGMESLYYLKKTNIPVLEVEFRSAGSITTEISF